jgi:hypothetical protein
VQNQAADHHISAAIGQRQITHISRVELDPIRHTQDVRVGPRRLRSVARLVDTTPHIDPDRSPSWQTSRGGEQHETTSTPEIDHRLVPAQGEPSSSSSQIRNFPRKVPCR